MIYLITALCIIFGTLLSVGLIRMAAPANDYERHLDDEAQMAYLKGWRERKTRSN